MLADALEPLPPEYEQYHMYVYNLPATRYSLEETVGSYVQEKHTLLKYGHLRHSPIQESDGVGYLARYQQLVVLKSRLIRVSKTLPHDLVLDLVM